MATVAFSDLHGNYKLWELIRDYYKEDDTLIFLGDACDRGPDGIKIMQELLEDKRVIYIKGNHEEMFLNYVDYGVIDVLRIHSQKVRENGTNDTLNAYLKLLAQDKCDLVENLKTKTKNYYIYINKEGKTIFLSHAGINFEDINNLKEKDLIWDRKHIAKKDYDNRYDNWYIVHGHTPTQFLTGKDEPMVCTYYNGHKIDIDVASFATNTTATIDLDNFGIKYFEGDK